jgi:hypothetical protein
MGNIKMTDNMENIIIEHLRAIRGDVGSVGADVSEIKSRLTSIDERLTLVEKGTANIHGDMALLQLRLDRQGDRIERIEKRLDLAPA